MLALLSLLSSLSFASTAPSPGFLVNEPAAALAQAQREQKPLLIHFYGIWCPPCNLLDQNVYRDPAFIRATQGWVKLKLDADRELSWDLKTRYRVGGYPTVVLADFEGGELGRIVGYRKPTEFVAAVEKAAAARSQSFDKLLVKARAGDTAAALTAGHILLERAEYAEALKVLPQTPGAAADRDAAEVGLAEKAEAKGDPEAKVRLVAALRRSLESFPDTPDSLSRRARLAELTGDTNLLSEAAQRAEAMATQPKKLAGLDYTPGDLFQMAASYREELKQDPAARALWKKAANYYRKEARGAEDRGAHLELAYCLWKSGEPDIAKRIYTRFEKNYPDEFTFYYGHGSMLLNLKQAPAAEAKARKALEFAYGDNRLRTAGLLAKALRDQGKKDEARATIREAIAAARLPADMESRMDQGVRTYRYVQTLLSIENQLEK